MGNCTLNSVDRQLAYLLMHGERIYLRPRFHAVSANGLYLSKIYMFTSQNIPSYHGKKKKNLKGWWYEVHVQNTGHALQSEPGGSLCLALGNRGRRYFLQNCCRMWKGTWCDPHMTVRWFHMPETFSRMLGPLRLCAFGSISLVCFVLIIGCGLDNPLENN